MRTSRMCESDVSLPIRLTRDSRTEYWVSLDIQKRTYSLLHGLPWFVYAYLFSKDNTYDSPPLYRYLEYRYIRFYLLPLLKRPASPCRMSPTGEDVAMYLLTPFLQSGLTTLCHQAVATTLVLHSCSHFRSLILLIVHLP